MCLPKPVKSAIHWDATNGINEWEPKGRRVILDVTLDRGNHDPTTQQCDYSRSVGQWQDRFGGTMVKVPGRDSSQTQQDRLCVRPMVTPVRSYPKSGWHSFIFADPRQLTQWFGRTHGGVLVLDDLMEEGGQDKRVLDLFTKDSHHRNITVLYLTQDLFPPGKFSKTINRNAHYIVEFKKPRDQTGIRTILLQAFPERWRQVLRLFKGVTSRLLKVIKAWVPRC